MIVKIDHIGIAVNSLDEAIKPYSEGLGLKVKTIETIEEQKVRAAMIPVGESMIELLESTDPEGVIAKHIERKGEGLHHLALEVSNIKGMLKRLKENLYFLLGSGIIFHYNTGYFFSKIFSLSILFEKKI